jgi:hypothetical protein
VEQTSEQIIMMSEVEGRLGILDVLLGGRHSKNEVDDALALFLLSSNEIPSDPSLDRCLQRFEARVLSDSSGDDFWARVRSYLERHPIDPELIAAIQAHFEAKQSNDSDRARAQSEQFLAVPMARMTISQKPAGGMSWLQTRVSTCTPKT